MFFHSLHLPSTPCLDPGRIPWRKCRTSRSKISKDQSKRPGGAGDSESAALNDIANAVPSGKLRGRENKRLAQVDARTTRTMHYEASVWIPPTYVHPSHRVVVLTTQSDLVRQRAEMAQSIAVDANILEDRLK